MIQRIVYLDANSGVAPTQMKENTAIQSNDLPTFLNSLGMSIYRDIARKVDEFLHKFRSMAKTSSVEQWSDAVQDFFSFISDHVAADVLYQGRVS